MITEAPHWRTLDKRGQMLPWYTRPCLEWLVTLPLGEMTVFEYGCGVSSEWFTDNAAIAYGVDHDRTWTPSGFGYECITDKEKYIAQASRWLPYFDLIVIDGIYRDECTETALKYLAPGGYLIIDNFEQPSADLAHWPKTRELTKNLPLTIYKEPGHPDWQTAVFHNV